MFVGCGSYLVSVLKARTSTVVLAFGAKTWKDLEKEDVTAGTEKIDWSKCSPVEVTLGLQSGAPVLCGARMPVDAITYNFDYNVSAAEIGEQFQIPFGQVEAILTYAKSPRVAHSL